MAKCPFCKHILRDVWLKKMGASLMGKASGERKARSRESTQAAARIRWDNVAANKKNSVTENPPSRKPSRKKKKIPT